MYDGSGASTRAHHILILTFPSRATRVGWYHNNCGCAEKGFSMADVEKQMRGDVHATVFQYGYDSLKLDGCGQKLNLTLWASLLNATGKAILMENSHGGRDLRRRKLPRLPRGLRTDCAQGFGVWPRLLCAVFGEVDAGERDVPHLPGARQRQ